MIDWKGVAKNTRRDRNYYRRLFNKRAEELYQIRKYARELFGPLFENNLLKQIEEISDTSGSDGT